MKKRARSKVKKLYLLVGVIGIVFGCMALAALQPSSRNTDKTVVSNTSPGDSSSSQVQESKAVEENTNTTQTASIPDLPPTDSPVNVPFQISKVYFSEAPKSPAPFNTCTLDQNITYTATADITATAAGVAVYHWAIGDHARGTSKNEMDQTVVFTSAGTKKVSYNFTYTVIDLASYYGLSGSKFYNRQYLNVIVTSPNGVHANIDSPVYGAGSFIWGTYVDLC